MLNGPTVSLNLLPKSDEAEKVILGAMLLEPDHIVPMVEGMIEASDFYHRAHRKIYRTIMELFYAGRAADLVGVADHLSDAEGLEQVGGRLYLNSLLDAITTVESVPYYAQIIRAKSWRRRLIEAGGRMTELGYHSDGDITKTQETAMSIVNEAILEKGIEDEIHPLADLEKEYLERLKAEKRAGRPESYLTTGFETLDRRIPDLTGQFMVVAGSSSIGKSLFMLNMAYKQAKKGIRVGFLSLEMLEIALLDRLLENHAGITDERRKFTPMEDLSKKAGEILRLPIWTVALGTSSLFGILRQMRQLVLRDEVRCIYIDYLQLIGDVISSQRVSELEDICRHALLFAKKYKVGVVIGSQFSREAMTTADKRPELWMLRGSGGIENAADVVIGLFRPEYADKTKSSGIMEIHWLKNRNGRRNIMDRMSCNLELQRIEDLAGERSEEEEEPITTLVGEKMQKKIMKGGAE